METEEEEKHEEQEEEEEEEKLLEVCMRVQFLVILCFVVVRCESGNTH